MRTVNATLRTSRYTEGEIRGMVQAIGAGPGGPRAAAVGRLVRGGGTCRWKRPPPAAPTKE
ncbi:hypothetical protein GCM10023079_42080 [Streptomyces chitinivorans]